MKNVFAALTLSLALVACGARDDIDVQPDTSGNGGNGGGNIGNGGAGNACSTCDTDSVDGARLKAQWIKGEDGSKIRKGDSWTDTGFNGETCSFQALPTGETRCLPPHEVVNTFSDSNCKIPIYVMTNGCAKPSKFVRVDYYDTSNPQTCGNPVTDSLIFAVDIDGEIPAPQPSYYVKSSEKGWCNGGWTVPMGGRAFKTLTHGAEMIDFVSANVD